MTPPGKRPLWSEVYKEKRAREYPRLMKLSGGKWYLDMLGAAAQALALGEEEPGFVLELGTGTGRLAARVLGRYPRARLVCVDGSEAMLSRARKALRRHASRVRFFCRDFGRAGWREGLPAADAAVSTIAIHHLTHAGKRRLFREVFGLLKPGGLFVNGDPVWPRDARLRERDDLMWAKYVQGRYLRAEGRLKPIEELKRFIDETRAAEGDKPASLEDQLRWLGEAGFEHADCFWKTHGFAVFGGAKPRG